jgi:hypothetical protein
MPDEKPISYVRLMREIRDQVNRETAGMTFEEHARWLQEQLVKAEPLFPRHDRGQPRK